MNAWIWLIIAIISEVVATSFLKATEGFSRLGPSIVVMIGYIGSFWCVSQTLDTIPIGVAYAVWSGVGIAALAVVTVVLHDQRLDAAAVIGMGLIIAGVVVLRLFSETTLEA